MQICETDPGVKSRVMVCTASRVRDPEADGFEQHSSLLLLHHGSVDGRHPVDAPW